MNETISIRRAKTEDCVPISELIKELGYYISLEDVQDKILQFSSNSKDQIFVAEIYTRVVGLISLHIIPCLHENTNVGRITSFVVAKEHRRRGIGSRLIKEAERFMWSQNCSRVEITSNDSRANAHEFYKKLGYLSDDRRFIKRKT